MAGNADNRDIPDDVAMSTSIDGLLEQRSLLSRYLIPAGSAPASEPERVHFFGDSQLAIVVGDITESQAAVLVSSDDYLLSMSGGVSAAIAAAGGSSIRFDASKRVPARIGDVLVTSAGTLPAQYVFHVITIGPGASEVSAKQVVEEATQRCMQLLDMLGLDTIAFPAIGSGAAGMTEEHVLLQMAKVLAVDLAPRKRPVRVSLYVWSRAGDQGGITDAFLDAIASMPGVTQTVNRSEHYDPRQPSLAEIERPSSQAERRNVLTRLAELQREQEETELALSTALPTVDRELRERLNAIVDERIQLARERTELPKLGLKVFVSYAREDVAYRIGLQKALSVLERSGKVNVFVDQQIKPGADWDRTIQTQLDSAELILLLLSSDFLASDYIDSVEMATAKERYEHGEVRVVPIILRHCNWNLTWLKLLNVLPTDDSGLLPVSDWPNRDKAYTAITNAIDGVIDQALAELGRP